MHLISSVLGGLLILVSQSLFSQNRDTTDLKPGDIDLIEILLKALRIKAKSKTPKEGVIYFSIIPSTSSTSSGNKVLFSSINAAFYMGSPATTYLSSVYFVPYTNLAHQYGFTSTQNLWTNNNRWNLPGEFKIQKLSPYSYGLGSNTERAKKFVIDYNYIRVYFTGNRKLRQFIYGGIGLNYDRYFSVNLPETTVSYPFSSYGFGTTSSSSSLGLTFNLLYDNRRNSINPDKGFYSTLIFRDNPGFLSNDDTWTSVYADARKYVRFPTKKRSLLAIWTFYWGSFGKVPYLNLPGTGLEYNARSGRGYDLGRFRGRQMFYLESEYRFTISENGLFGGVFFANAQSLEEPISHSFQSVNLAAGFGARIKFNKASNINLDLDFGFGKDSFNFYINLGELF
jgi:hypothetical protein